MNRTRLLVLAIVALLVVGATPPAFAQDSAWIAIIVERLDDQVGNDGPFRGGVVVNTSGTSVITTVSYEVDGGAPVQLTPDASQTEWSWEKSYASLDALKTELDGSWSVAVFRGFPNPVAVVSTFTVTVSGLTDGDIYPSPAFTDPVNGDSAVPPGTSISWNDPSGASTPDLLQIELMNSAYTDGSVDQGDGSNGGLSVTSTTWNPATSLSPGAQDVELTYFLADSSLASAIAITGTPSPAFTWVLSPFAPGGYPSDRPLMALASATQMAFGVSLTEDFDAYSVQSDTTGTTVGSTTVYAVTDGTPVPVASVSEQLANGAGVVADVTQSLAWSLTSQSGSTGTSGAQTGFVLIGDLPALANGTTGGPFSGFFGSDPGSRTPRDLDRSFFSLRARETTGASGTSFRLLLTDADDNQIATATTGLSTASVFYGFQLSDFVDLVDSSAFDATRVVGLSVEHFAPPGTAPALDLRVDDVAIEFVPEPSAALLGLGALVTLSASRAMRRRG